MSTTYRTLARLSADDTGSMAVEFAFAVPILAVLLLGTVDIGFAVARQTELQSAVSEVESVILATNMGAATNPAELEAILIHSVDLSEDDIAIVRKFRCGVATTLVDDIELCLEDDVVSSYLEIDITDTYTPQWVAFGVDEAFTLSVERTVQIS